MRSLCSLGLVAATIVAACGAKPGPATTPAAAPADDESTFAPLDVGADWATYAKMNRAPVPSKTHGGRFVDTYVNDVGAPAYWNDDAELPVGTVIVKTSWEPENGAPSSTPGPIFVMKKMPPGYAPDHEDWYYAIHWAQPTPAQLKVLKGPIYWRGHSPKVSYCSRCHDNYVRSLGGVPAEYRAE